MSNNYLHEDHGPEVMDWFKELQRNNYQQGRNLQTREGASRNFSRRSHKKNIGFRKRDLIMLAIPTGLALSSLITNAAAGINTIYQRNQGAKIVYDRLVQEGNIPADLDIDYFLEGKLYDISYQTIDGEVVKRQNVDIKDFVNDICVAALDNGVTEDEIAVGFAYVGLEEKVIENLMQVTSEQISQCEMENYNQWLLDSKEIEHGRKM